jgi:adenosine deaminase
MTGATRDLRALPKAHLHLHFTGAMRHGTMLDLATAHRVHLPDVLRDVRPPHLRATDERGWFRFQRLYDTARSVLQQPDDLRRLLLEVAHDEVADGSRWLEIQVDPSGYAGWFGGLTQTMELILAATAEATAATGLRIGVIVGANRTRHPLDARTLARLAVQYVDHGVVGFGLANDERRGRAEDFAHAFAIADRGGLAAVPHGGELCGAESVAACVDVLGATRVGHGVRSVEDPALVERLATDGVTLEVCPTSNVALGVFPTLADVPLVALSNAGVPVALGADDPLLFGARLTAQYEAARTVHGMDDAAVAELARQSVRGSLAPDSVKAEILQGIDAWLTAPA